MKKHQSKIEQKRIPCEALNMCDLWSDNENRIFIINFSFFWGKNNQTNNIETNIRKMGCVLGCVCDKCTYMHYEDRVVWGF